MRRDSSSEHESSRGIEETAVTLHLWGEERIGRRLRREPAGKEIAETLELAHSG